MTRQMINERAFSAESIRELSGTDAVPHRMSIGETVHKSPVLFGLTCAFATTGWSRAETVIRATSGPSWLLGYFVLIALSSLAIANPRLAPIGGFVSALLMLGRDHDDRSFLQAKEAQGSVLEPFVCSGAYRNQGEGVVRGQRLMQAVSDIFLGWDRVRGLDGTHRDHYIRQLRDWKGSLDPAAMLPEEMVRYARACPWTLARAHPRSGDRIAIASHLGRSDRSDRAIATFAEAYAEQYERDHDSLMRAVKDGRVPVQEA